MAHDTLTITIQSAQRVIDAFCRTYGYQETVPNPDYVPGDATDPENVVAAVGQERIPNPETPADFTSRKVKEHMVSVVKSSEASETEVNL